MAQNGLNASSGRVSAIEDIVLQNSFCATDHKFSELWTRLSNKYVRDLITR
jgi:hypothetical protein